MPGEKISTKPVTPTKTNTVLNPTTQKTTTVTAPKPAMGGGNSPAGLPIGTIRKTEGGDYQIVAPGTPGASYNPASGYYSIKVGTDAGATVDQVPRPSIGNTGAITGSDYYAKQLAEQQAGIQAGIQARIDQAIAANNAYIPQIDQRSDQALRNAYIAREQSRLNAPQALSAMGIGGGAAESSLLGIQTGYENTRNLVEDERMRALEGLRQNEAQIRATGDSTLADAASQYYNNLAKAAQQAEQNAINQANWEAEFALNERKYNDAAAQQAWQNAYDERLFQMQNQPTNTTYRSNVSNAQTANVDAGRVAPVSSGNYNTVWNNVQRALGGSNAGSQRAFDAAINYIQNSLKGGMITEYEAQQMLNRLNL